MNKNVKFSLIMIYVVVAILLILGNIIVSKTTKAKNNPTSYIINIM